MNIRIPIFWLALLLSLVSPGLAHSLDEGVISLSIQGQFLEGELKLPRAILGFADSNNDGYLVEEELESHREAVEQIVRRGFSLDSGDAPVAYQILPIESSSDVQVSHVIVALKAPWSPGVERLAVSFNLFDGGKTNRAILRVRIGARTLTDVLLKERPRVEIATVSTEQRIWQFFGLGVEHLITGYDHVLFLAALILGGGSARNLLIIITTFTVAHSLTLALSVLEIVSLPSRPVEISIAASIVIAALLNLHSIEERSLKSRAALAGGFGLLHGLGFAGILGEMQVSGRDAMAPLLGFNLGVEAGQLLVVLCFYPVLRAAQSSPRFPVIVKIGSWVLVAWGCWFLWSQIAG